jgi:hypothetical protein
MNLLNRNLRFFSAGDRPASSSELPSPITMRRLSRLLADVKFSKLNQTARQADRPGRLPPRAYS